MSLQSTCPVCLLMTVDKLVLTHPNYQWCKIWMKSSYEALSWAFLPPWCFHIRCDNRGVDLTVKPQTHHKLNLSSFLTLGMILF